MSNMTKVFIVLTAVLAIAESCLFIAFAAQRENWKGLAVDYQRQRDSAHQQMMNTRVAAQAALALKDQALADQKRALADSQKKTQAQSTQLARAQSDVSQFRNESFAANAGRTRLEGILETISAQRDAVERRNQELLSQNIDFQTRNSRLNERALKLTTDVQIHKEQIRNMQEKLYALERENTDLQKQIATGRPTRPAPEAPAGVVAAKRTVKGEIRGEITEVDGSYASISVGESSGVVAGMTFMVWRKDVGYLADLVVERVRPDRAGGRLTTLVSGEIRRGDLVVIE